MWFLAQQFSLMLAAPLCAILSLIHIKFMAEFLHEGAHFNFYYQRSWNDFYTNLLTGVFLGTSAEKYRNLHFQHHSFQTFFQAEDPETCLLQMHTKRDLFRAIISDITGLTGLKIFLKYTSSHPKNSAAAKSRNFEFSLIFFMISHVLILFFAYRLNFLPFYFIYYFTLSTLYPLQLRMKILCQHVKLDFKSDAKISFATTTSRTIKGGLLEQVFFTSEITAYHELHHRFPNYPYRKLAALHAESNISFDPNIFTANRLLILRRLYRALT